MRIPIYQVDAFTSRLFGGNPAAICPLESWLDDRILQAIALENNLSETAFLVPMGERYHLRWFTPACEIDLCGHATLASAYVVFNYLKKDLAAVQFMTISGELVVRRQDDLLAMDFPSRPPEPCDEDTVKVGLALGKAPVDLLAARDYLAVYESEADVRTLEPDFKAVAQLGRMVIVTAPGEQADFVSRFFAPAHGVDEDPVTGSAHCTLAPYWSKRLDKKLLTAWQVSRRGGELFCEDRGARVTLAGNAVPYLEGAIFLE
ncbi:MAG TPA: PhzF family phenazine biosynthesis protein [Bryobacteraceae bacterium]|nr:PhzF family phenazine biosynthesis protein [Bryobacteraceae bacterium]